MTRPALCHAHVRREAPRVWEVTLRVTGIPIRVRQFTTWQKALLYACRSTGVR